MFLYILFAVIGIILDYVIAVEMESIAENKGCKTPKRYFWFCFLLGLPGWLMVVALPNQKTEKLLLSVISDKRNFPEPTVAKPETAEPPTPRVKETTAAPSDSHDTTEEPAPVIESTVVAVVVDDRKIKCTKCGTVQNAGRRVCWECGAVFVMEG